MPDEVRIQGLPWQQAADVVLSALGVLRDGSEAPPLWQASAALRQRVSEPQPMPATGQPLADVMHQAAALLREGLCNVGHPRYFGYISPQAHPATLLGDLLGSALNQTPGAWRAGPAATVVEVEVLCWLRELFGLPPVTGSLPGGVFTGGGTLANLLALKLARDQILGPTVRERGLDAASCRIYLSEEGHFSIGKALDTLGFGHQSLVLVPCDAQGAMLPQALARQVAEDQARGLRALCIVATAGTTASGAVDPLQDIADIAARAGAWFHVDGASGLAMAALPEVRAAMRGLERADSITFDPCKWMFAAFGVGCLLVRDGAQLWDAFGSGGHYWEERDELDTFKMNLYGTRQFRSLGLWCLMHHLGAEGYAALLLGLRRSADHLRALLARDARYTMLPQQTHMPIVAFRPTAPTPERASAWAEQLVARCQADNLAYPTVLQWRGEKYLRVAVSNYATTPADMDAFKRGMDELLQQVGG